MPKALEHAYSEYVQSEDGGDRAVFVGHLRIVRNARRARLLKRRGVEMDCYESHTRKYWVWYETEHSFRTRALARRVARSLRRKVRLHQRIAGLAWVESFLRDVFVAPLDPTFVQQFGHAPRSLSDYTAQVAFEGSEPQHVAYGVRTVVSFVEDPGDIEVEI